VQGLSDAVHIHPHRKIQVTQQNLDNQFKNSVESKQSGRLVPGSWVVQILGCISKSATIPCKYRKNPGLVFWRRSQRVAATTINTILRHPGAPAPGPRGDLRLSLFWQKPYTSVSLYYSLQSRNPFKLTAPRVKCLSMSLVRSGDLRAPRQKSKRRVGTHLI
jgi:hypothetical protein